MSEPLLFLHLTSVVVGMITELCRFRARPVIDIKKEIKFTPKEIDLTKKNCPKGFW